MGNSTSTDVTTLPDRLDDDTLAGLTDVAAVAKFFDDNGVTAVSVADYGSGFTLLDTDEKQQLIGVPFVIIEWHENLGEQGAFASVVLITERGDRFIINDGSTGIFAQLQTIFRQRNEAGHAKPHMGIKVPNGLSRSDYYRHTDGSISRVKPEGDGWAKATTFYLA